MECSASHNQNVSIDDEIFVSGVNKRTPESFRTLYSSLDKPLIRFSNKYLNCTPDAEDVVHDVFIQFWQSKYTFSDIKSIRSFLFTATKNKTINYLKRKRRVVNNIDFLEFEAAEERPASFFDFSYEIKSMFETSLGQLPEQCEKIMKSFKEGLNSIEIAIRYKLAPSTVRAQKRRGIKLIRAFFSSRLSSQLSSRYL
ncbi:MAG: hypothetical protein A2X19_06985 [Bacteroidetes bacterium GWE2_39_28]|nr:MAG: hypothetical protein A2X19_06985 [Bacteroidetes bacterium GWE2_39_28]OFY13700.1 MAG: hypothetical protein A2X16_03820 [Bacteroidetes bacterium GWF2_39_10]OFZ10590.1 MAG: hypothetical protein A2465_08065 [Bacteroidetes bacterium RIFOXYC2_FULL_39_11]